MKRGARGLVILLPLLLSGCLYSFKAGSFPPPYIKTVAIEPFDNETTRFELTGELYDQLLKRLPSALGIRTAGADVADAVVKGTIVRYDVAAPNYRAGAAGQAAQVLQRQVTISVKVQIIDQVNNVVLWEDTGVVAQGQFADATETEDVGRTQAITTLVQKIVDGAQSNW
ncbi:MAG: LPS assembly lipoprotein LptE [Gemmatimonadetes bacterium]|nr:LPS assembly lipoprotein LptE [Gemmatimonadota bacterium]